MQSFQLETSELKSVSSVDSFLFVEFNDFGLRESATRPSLAVCWVKRLVRSYRCFKGPFFGQSVSQVRCESQAFDL